MQALRNRGFLSLFRCLFDTEKISARMQKTAMFQTRVKNNLIGFRQGSEKPLAFHCDTLDVAELSEDSWQALAEGLGPKEIQTPGVSKALAELLSWADTSAPSVPAKPRARHKIDTLTVNVTQICNLACTYCAAGGDGTYGDPTTKISVDKTLPQLSFFLGKLDPGDKFTLTFLGGEPLLYPEGIELISKYLEQEAKQKNITLRLRIVTNGTLLNQKNIELLTRFKMHVVISLDGPPEINDAIRKTKSSNFNTASILKNLESLMARKNELASISLAAVFGSGNLEVLKCYEFLSSFPVDSLSLCFDHSSHDSSDSQKFFQEMQLVAESAWSKGQESELRRIEYFDKVFMVLDQKIRITNFCGSGKNFLMVDAKNTLTTCPWQAGKPEESVGHGPTLFEDRLAPYQEDLVSKNNCHSCWAKYLCGGGCMYSNQQATGSKHIKDAVFCERQRGLSLLALSYYGKCNFEDGYGVEEN